MHYKVKIGMETHFELLTKTKIFCACATNFNAQPNKNCCPICLGLPGAMPALNAEVLKLAIKAVQLTNCAISNTVSFDRKNYFYPDLPKGYQVTQHKKPIGKNGYIELSSGKKIRKWYSSFGGCFRTRYKFSRRSQRICRKTVQHDEKQ